MKPLFFLTFLILASACSNELDNSTTSQIKRAKLIIGLDNREEVKNHSSKFLKEVSKSVAIQIENKFFKNNKLQFDKLPSLSERLNICTDERFSNQPAAGECSAFLIGPDLMMTAGHCFDLDYSKTITENCKSYKWVFDYEKGKDSSPSNVFNCAKVEYIRADYEEESDYAIFRLDRKVKNKPFFNVTLNSFEKDTPVAMIGSPFGTYKKITDGGKFLRMENHLLLHDLDSFGGNSGSPIINMKTKEVIAIHIQGSALSLINDENKNCKRYNRSCDEASGYPCQAGVGFPNLSMSSWLFKNSIFDLNSF